MAKNLLMKLFDQMLYDLSAVPATSSERTLAVARQRTRLRKRAQLGGEKVLHDLALESFLDLNAEVADSSVSLDKLIINEARAFIENFLWRFHDLHSDFNCAPQTSFDLHVIMEHWKFGPGASNEVKGTHTAEKICQPMTSTPRCARLVKALRLSHPYLAAFDSQNKNDGITLVDGSRTTTVPKNEDEVRVIAIEASGNMALQLAGGQVITNALRCIGLDITNQQPKNKSLARRGSIDGSVFTMDLKKASDRQLLELMRALWPREWYDFFMTTRSPQTTIKWSNGEIEVVKLNMLSTMGNGFTFPVMTATLLALIYANRRVNHNGGRYIDWRTTAVFGDDIIAPTAEYDSLKQVLTNAGYVVNQDKSYFEGPFRESCGGDYMNGYDVTPFYVKSLASLSDKYIVLNQCLSWCARNNVYMGNTIQYLLSLVGQNIFLVPEWMPNESGIRCSDAPRNFNYWRFKSIPKKIPKGHFFEYSLAAGGYISSCGERSTFTSREGRIKFERRKGMIPRGYQSSWDPLSRTQDETNFVTNVLTLVGLLKTSS